MATIIPRIESSHVISNLDTYTHTALNNSIYKVAIRVTDIPPSGLIINIQQNGVTKAGFSSPSPTQSDVELQVLLNCSVSDVINVILSSNSNVDKNINDIKAILIISQGLF